MSIVSMFRARLRAIERKKWADERKAQLAAGEEIRRQMENPPVYVEIYDEDPRFPSNKARDLDIPD